MDKAVYEELKVNARLHGMELKPYIEPVQLDDKEREFSDKHAKKVFERMKKKWQTKNS